MSKFVRVNDRIRVSEVRLIDSEGQQVGVVSIQDALKLAREEQLDLVEVAPDAKPPVCRVMDYMKFKYEQAKKEREAKKKQKVMHIKELRFKPKIGEHDYLVKLKKLEEFLQDHDKVRVRMTFRGREMAHMEFGEQILQRLVKDIGEKGELERPPVKEGRNILLIFRPK